MASVSTDKSGRRRILFVAPDGSRRTVRLGKTDRRTAEAVARHVEGLVVAQIAGQAPSRETAAWLAGVGAPLRERLAAVGLVEPEKRLTVGEFLASWLDGKRAAGHKPTSLRAWGQTVAGAVELFGARPLASLTHKDGEDFRERMRSQGLRPTTVSKRLGHARQMLEDAVRLGHLPANPWRYVRQRCGDVAERRAYVSLADVERVLEACPNVHWRLLVALARFAGLRVPSEAFSLTWADVDWERGRLTVPSPKTEHLGKPHRVVPLFPLLRPHLEEAWELAPEGAVHVFPDSWRTRAQGADGWAGANLRTPFGKILRRAGITPWPRMWHSLRASCESDLAQSFPLAVVTKWLGNTPSVALRHYVDPTESAFALALNWRPGEQAHSGAKSGALEAQNPAQQEQAYSCMEWNESPKGGVGEPLAADACISVHHGAQAYTGVYGNRTLASFPQKTADSPSGGAKSGALDAADPALARLVRVWPQLPEDVKDVLLAMVGGWGGEG